LDAGACEAMDGRARAAMDGAFASPASKYLLHSGGKTSQKKARVTTSLSQTTT
jgi:hypothetical protein